MDSRQKRAWNFREAARRKAWFQALGTWAAHYEAVAGQNVRETYDRTLTYGMPWDQPEKLLSSKYPDARA